MNTVLVIGFCFAMWGLFFSSLQQYDGLGPGARTFISLIALSNAMAWTLKYAT